MKALFHRMLYSSHWTAYLLLFLFTLALAAPLMLLVRYSREIVVWLVALFTQPVPYPIVFWLLGVIIIFLVWLVVKPLSDDDEK